MGESESERESQTYVTSSALRPLEEEIEGRWRDDDERVKSLMREEKEFTSVCAQSHFGPPHSTAEALTTGSGWKPTGSTLSVFCSTASKMAEPS